MLLAFIRFRWVDNTSAGDFSQMVFGRLHMGWSDASPMLDTDRHDRGNDFRGFSKSAGRSARRRHLREHPQVMNRR
jgi:hypothetical protein